MRRTVRTRLRALVFLAAGSLALLAPRAAAARAGGPVLTEVAVWAGRFDVLENDSSTEVGAELRYRPFWEGSSPIRWRLAPAWGTMVTSERSAYVYAGFRLELPLGPRWRLVPQSGAGLYHQGDGKDLGGPVEFRSGFELDLRLGDAHNVGLIFYHLSNAVLYDQNPGAESLALQLTWRLGGR